MYNIKLFIYSYLDDSFYLLMISDSRFRQVFLRNCIIFKIRKVIVIHFRQLKLQKTVLNFQTEEELGYFADKGDLLQSDDFGEGRAVFFEQLNPGS
jgi:hypothetical protein